MKKLEDLWFFLTDRVHLPPESKVTRRRHATVNLLSANPTKLSNTLTQFAGKLPTNCLSVFDHFVGLALERVNQQDLTSSWYSFDQPRAIKGSDDHGGTKWFLSLDLLIGNPVPELLGHFSLT